MTKIGQKIKDVLTPGSKTEDTTYGTAGAGAGYGTTGTADTYGPTEPLGTGMQTTRTTEECTTCVPAQPVAGVEGGNVCGQEFFSKTEDRPVVREQVERILEHHPVEKQYVVEQRFIGEKPMTGTTESLGTTERIVSEAAPRSPCE